MQFKLSLEGKRLKIGYSTTYKQFLQHIGHSAGNKVR